MNLPIQFSCSCIETEMTELAINGFICNAFKMRQEAMRNGKTYPLFANSWITSYYYYYYFLSAKKWNLCRHTYRKTLRTILFDISKDVLDSPFVLDLWSFTELFVFLRKTLVSRSSQKPLTLHAWKFIYNKILISRGHCVFELHVQWTVKELLPLKLCNFYVKILNF